MTMLYNPDLLPGDVLRRQFVARTAVLQRLVEALAHERPGHVLLVGARGMGKTTLLRRLGLEVREDPALGERWIPLSFPEEQYNVARLDDVWANCVDALADWYESTGRAVALRLGLRGLRRAARELGASVFRKAAEDGLNFLRVDAPVPWRLAQLSSLRAPETAAALVTQLSLLAAGGHDADAIAWLDANGLADSLAPLREALRIRRAGDRELLLGLAPEVRAPVETVLRQIDTFAAAGGFMIAPDPAFNLAWEAERARIEGRV